MSAIRTFFLALVGGGLFSFIHVPLPWTLGPIAAVSLTALVTGRQQYWPRWVREIALIVLGYAMGRPFTLETGQAIISQLPIMLAATFLTIAAGVFTGWLMYRRTGINLISCLLGCVPGGLSQMVILAAEMKEADATAITIMQTLRMLSVVFTVPFLTMHVFSSGGTGGLAAAEAMPIALDTILTFAAVAICGAIAARWLHLPTAFLLGPILSTGAYVLLSGGQVAPMVPVHYIYAAQICVSSYIGSTIDLAKIRDYHGMGPCLFGGIVFVLLVSLLSGFGVAMLTQVDFATAFLSTAPGGLAEMGITALTVGADISTMTAYQLVRLLFIMLVFPYLAKWLVRLHEGHRQD